MADINHIGFVRHPRARRYVIRVADDGSVRVTVPRWGSKREAAAFAEEQRAWIEKQQRRLQQARLERESSPRPGRTPSEFRALRTRAKHELAPRLLTLAAIHGV